MVPPFQDSTCDVTIISLAELDQHVLWKEDFEASRAALD